MQLEGVVGCQSIMDRIKKANVFALSYNVINIKGL